MCFRRKFFIITISIILAVNGQYDDPLSGYVPNIDDGEPDVAAQSTHREMTTAGISPSAPEETFMEKIIPVPETFEEKTIPSPEIFEEKIPTPKIFKEKIRVPETFDDKAIHSYEILKEKIIPKPETVKEKIVPASETTMAKKKLVHSTSIVPSPKTKLQITSKKGGKVPKKKMKDMIMN